MIDRSHSGLIPIHEARNGAWSAVRCLSNGFIYGSAAFGQFRSQESKSPFENGRLTKECREERNGGGGETARHPAHDEQDSPGIVAQTLPGRGGRHPRQRQQRSSAWRQPGQLRGGLAHSRDSHCDRSFDRSSVIRH